jgi:hypothetical protein
MLVLFWSSLLAAQVLSPMEMKDSGMRRLQQRHLKQLQAIAGDLNQHTFPYAFYFSRKLDIDEQEQKREALRSIRFERYNNRTTLEFTGNYYASYSAERVDAKHRLRQTYINVIYPILQAAVQRLGSESEVEAFAIEVSHHVRRTVMGVSGEFPENVVVIVPRELALEVVRSADLTVQQNLMLDAEVYISAQPALLWLAGDRPVVAEVVRLTNGFDLHCVRHEQDGDVTRLYLDDSIYRCAWPADFQLRARSR